MSLADILFGQRGGAPVGTPPIAPRPQEMGGEQQPQRRGGIGGFLNEMVNPTNPLGQIGMALIAAGGDPAGAAQLVMQQNAAREKQGPRVEHVGNQIGIVDPRTGQFTPTYTPMKEPTGFDAELIANGIDPNSEQGKQMKRQKLDNGLDPWVNFSSPQGSFSGPRSMMGRLPGALGMEAPETGVVPQGTLGAPVGKPVGKITPLDGDPFAGGGVGNGAGGFRVPR